jgi:hypothetical protein
MTSPQLSSTDPKKQDLLAPFKSVFFQYFEQLVDSCCLRLDLEFGLQLGKNRDKTGMENYKNLLEYLRSVRSVIKLNYLLKLNESFDEIIRKKESLAAERLDMNAVSLASDDFIKEDYAATLIIRQCELLYHEDLTRLNTLIGALFAKPAITNRQNPVSPENLIRALFEVLRPLKFNSDHRLALYKTFEADVFSQMRLIYRELIKLCESSIAKLKAENGENIDKPRLSATPAEPLNEEFRALQEKLTAWRNRHAPSGYDPVPSGANIFYEHFEIKNALHILGQFSTHTKAINPKKEKKPLKWQALGHLEGLNFSNETKALAKTDEDVLDLVSIIFDEITKSECLSDTLKATLGQLEIPMSAACLGQYSAFINPDNPVRKLLDALFSAGLFLNADNEDNRLVFEKIAGIIKKMAKDPGFDIAGWSGTAKEFGLFLDTQKQDGRFIEERSIQAMIDQEAQSTQNKAVTDAIELGLNNKALPPAIIDFLRNIWRDVMLDAYSIKDQRPELWENSIKTMNELIASVIPPADDSEKKQILKFIPGMIKELRSGLKRISCDKKIQSRFFKELVVLHIILMDNKETKTAATGVNTGQPPSAGNSEAQTDPYGSQVNDLKVEDWLVFGLDTVKTWGKLARKSVNSEKLLFVGKNGEKIIQIAADELAEKLRRGQAALVEYDNQPITGRVLSELMGCNALPDH